MPLFNGTSSRFLLLCSFDSASSASRVRILLSKCETWKKHKQLFLVSQNCCDYTQISSHVLESSIDHIRRISEPCTHSITLVKNLMHVYIRSKTIPIMCIYIRIRTIPIMYVSNRIRTILLCVYMSFFKYLNLQWDCTIWLYNRNCPRREFFWI